MKLSEVHDRAADAIERYGHNRVETGNTKVGFCVLGAWAYVMGEEYEFGWWACLAFSIQEAASLPSGPIALWSDNSPTQVVLDSLRKAAKAERIKEEAAT